MGKDLLQHSSQPPSFLPGLLCQLHADRLGRQHMNIMPASLPAPHPLSAPTRPWPSHPLQATPGCTPACPPQLRPCFAQLALCPIWPGPCPRMNSRGRTPSNSHQWHTSQTGPESLPSHFHLQSLTVDLSLHKISELSTHPGRKALCQDRCT